MLIEMFGILLLIAFAALYLSKFTDNQHLWVFFSAILVLFAGLGSAGGLTFTTGEFVNYNGLTIADATNSTTTQLTTTIADYSTGMLALILSGFAFYLILISASTVERIKGA